MTLDLEHKEKAIGSKRTYLYVTFMCIFIVEECVFV